MTKETLNTNGYELKPVGHYTLEVEKIIREERIAKVSGKPFVSYKFKFDIRGYDGDAEFENNNLTLMLFKNQIGDILKALGAKEIKKGEFEFENGSVQFFKECEGKIIECNLVHAADNNGQDREMLTDVIAGEPQEKKAEEKVAWDE